MRLYTTYWKNKMRIKAPQSAQNSLTVNLLEIYSAI